MEIKLLSSDKVYWRDTLEHEFEIDGEKHQLRVYDTPDEVEYWFDEEQFYDQEDEVMDGITIENLLDRI